MRLAKPLHIILNKDLDDLATDAEAAFEGFPDTAAGGHMGAEFHGQGQRMDGESRQSQRLPRRRADDSF